MYRADSKLLLVCAAVSAGFCCAAAVPAGALPLAYEGFDYPDGTDVSGQTGGSGFSTAWSTSVGDIVRAGSLGYTDALGNVLPTSGGHGYFEGSTGTAQPNRTLPLVRGDDGTTSWFSFVGQRLGAKDGDPPSYRRGANISLFNSTLAASTEQLAIGEGTGRAEDTWSLIPDGGAGNTQASQVPFDQPSFIVVRIDHLAGNDNAYLFVNPVLGVEPNIATANATSIGSFDYSFNRIRPFAGNTTTAGVFAEIQLDEIRVGETYADVAPVPEPAGLTLLGLGALSLARRRRPPDPLISDL
jgi:MYXO-CTERM domain-containing protein